MCVVQGINQLKPAFQLSSSKVKQGLISFGPSVHTFCVRVLLENRTVIFVVLNWEATVFVQLLSDISNLIFELSLRGKV